MKKKKHPNKKKLIALKLREKNEEIFRTENYYLFKKKKNTKK